MVRSVNFKNFNPANLIFDKPDEQTSKAAGVKYYRIKVTYKYEDGSTGPLYIEGPMEKKSAGPKNDLTKEGKDNWNVFTRYDLSNPEHFAFVNCDDRDGKELGVLYKIKHEAAKFVFTNRKDCGLTTLKTLDSALEKVTNPTGWTPDEEDGYPKAGTNPIKSWNLVKYEWQGKTITTNFTLPSATSKDGVPLNWDDIDGKKVEIDHIPLIKIENVTIAAGKITVKMALTSSVVTKWTAKTHENMQAGTMAKMVEDASLAAELEDLKRQLMEERAKNAKASSPKKLPPNPVKIDIVEKVAVVEDNAVVIPGVAELKAAMSSSSAPPPPTDLKSVLNSTAGISISGDEEDEIEL